jgi:energy-coupling factor transport system permease protein
MLFEMYVNKDSFVHKLDPRVKLMWFFCVMVCAAIVNSAIPSGIVFAWIIFMAILARLPLKRLLLLTQALAYLIIVCILMWPLFVKSGPTVFEWDWFKVTYNGILVGVGMGFRLSSMILASAVVFMTTTQKELLESLRTIKIPEHFVFATVLALRYIPSLMGEWKTIAEAQACRDPGRGKGIVGKIKRITSAIGIPIAVPLIHRVAKMTNELSLALDSKGFNPDMRPIPYKELKIGRSDKACAVMSIAILMVYILARFFIWPQYMWIY